MENVLECNKECDPITRIEQIEKKLSEFKSYIDSGFEKVADELTSKGTKIKFIEETCITNLDTITRHISKENNNWQDTVVQIQDAFSSVDKLERNYEDLKGYVTKLQTQLDTLKTHIQENSESQIKLCFAVDQIEKTIISNDKSINDRMDVETKARKDSDIKMESDRKGDFRWRVGTIITIIVAIMGSLTWGLSKVSTSLDNRDKIQNQAIKENNNTSQSNYNEIKDLIHKTQIEFLEKLEKRDGK